MKTVIKVENISKEYRLGEVGTGTISRDINKWWAKIRGKEDPNSLILPDGQLKNNIELHKALSNVTFEVNEGDIIGIIGKNGAGKSTLLKILSRVTTPTTGSFKVKGRIASLLEVGTGFHPELTGRENIFLNGAILGMKKNEISRKFDEIVSFSGVEKFIDTPVKRYSSGMYVRLAFAVAAHLEPEILIVDEVLAVGDISFQNKCLGKMSEVSKQGRTILFVSHQMAALTQLCTRGILLENGRNTYDGSIHGAVNKYLSNTLNSKGPVFDVSQIQERKGTGLVQFSKIEFFKKKRLDNVYLIGEDMELRITLKAKKAIKNDLSIAIHIVRFDEIMLANIENVDSNFRIMGFENEIVLSVTFKNLMFYPETYKLGFWIADADNRIAHDHILNCAEFMMIDGSPLVSRELFKSKGSIFIMPEWKIL